MKLWMTLYAMIWIVFIDFLLAMTPGASKVLIYLHIALGIAIIGLAWYNFNGVRGTKVPGRVKRISKVTLNLSIYIGILGLFLYFGTGAAWQILYGITLKGLILFFHVSNVCLVHPCRIFRRNLAVPISVNLAEKALHKSSVICFFP